LVSVAEAATSDEIPVLWVP